MSNVDALLNSIDKIDDKYLTEALEYTPNKRRKGFVRVIAGVAAACIVFLVLRSFFMSNDSVKVYAYGSNKIISNEIVSTKNTVINAISKDATGMDVCDPLSFYVIGKDIAELSVSCEDQWLSVADYNERSIEDLMLKRKSFEFDAHKKSSKIVFQWHTDNKGYVKDPLNECEDRITIFIRYKNRNTDRFVMNVRLNADGTYSAFLTEVSSTALPTGAAGENIDITDIVEPQYTNSGAYISQSILIGSNSASLSTGGVTLDIRYKAKAEASGLKYDTMMDNLCSKIDFSTYNEDTYNVNFISKEFFPSYFGGAYINEYGDLVIQIVESYKQDDFKNSQIFDEIKELTDCDGEGIEIAFVKNSYYDLISAMEDIGMYFPEKRELPSWGIDDPNNTLKLRLKTNIDPAITDKISKEHNNVNIDCSGPYNFQFN